MGPVPIVLKNTTIKPIIKAHIELMAEIKTVILIPSIRTGMDSMITDVSKLYIDKTPPRS
jgi:hypothetical protein